MTYRPVPAGYYQSAHWKAKRIEALKHHNFTCQACGAKGGWLDIHHTPEAYGHPWNEPVHLLKPLCHGKCHRKGRYTASQIRNDRTDNRLLSAFEFVIFLPFRILWLIVRTAWRAIRR